MSDLTRLAGEPGGYEELGNTFSWFSLWKKPHLWFSLGPGGWDKRSPSLDHTTQGGCLSPLVALGSPALCTQCGNQGFSREMRAKRVQTAQELKFRFCVSPNWNPIWPWGRSFNLPGGVLIFLICEMGSHGCEEAWGRVVGHPTGRLPRRALGKALMWAGWLQD